MLGRLQHRKSITKNFYQLGSNYNLCLAPNDSMPGYILKFAD